MGNIRIESFKRGTFIPYHSILGLLLNNKGKTAIEILERGITPNEEFVKIKICIKTKSVTYKVDDLVKKPLTAPGGITDFAPDLVGLVLGDSLKLSVRCSKEHQLLVVAEKALELCCDIVLNEDSTVITFVPKRIVDNQLKLF